MPLAKTTFVLNHLISVTESNLKSGHSKMIGWKNLGKLNIVSGKSTIFAQRKTTHEKQYRYD